MPGAFEEVDANTRSAIADGDFAAMRKVEGGWLEDEQTHYLAFVLASAAEDCGDPDGDKNLEFYFDAKLVGDDDMLLAFYQLAHWFGTGLFLPKREDVANQYIDDIVDGYDDKPELSGPAITDRLEQLASVIGLPEGLDYSIALGPAMPDTPGNVHRRHLD